MSLAKILGSAVVGVVDVLLEGKQINNYNAQDIARTAIVGVLSAKEFMGYEFRGQRLVEDTLHGMYYGAIPLFIHTLYRVVKTQTQATRVRRAQTVPPVIVTQVTPTVPTQVTPTVPIATATPVVETTPPTIEVRVPSEERKLIY